jgi:hypothetical protein
VPGHQSSYEPEPVFELFVEELVIHVGDSLEYPINWRVNEEGFEL